MTTQRPRRRALLVDYGGVLTGPIGPSFAAFEAAHRIPEGRCFALLLAGSEDADGGVIGAVERGEVPVDAFERTLRDLLVADGHQPPDVPLLDGLFAALEPAGAVWDLTARAREAGVRTALVSNSWGTDFYPRGRLAAHFDELVISAEVGVRKPEPAIFHLACERLEVAPAEAVFIDDLHANVAAAAALGITGVHHTDAARTVAEVSALLGLSTP